MKKKGAPKKKAALTRTGTAPALSSPAMLTEVRELILATRQQVAQVVNAALTTLYWQVGNRIHREILKEKRAEYGKEIVSALGRQLSAEFGMGFGEKNLRRMVQFAESFPDSQIVAALLRQLGWTHFTLLIPFKDDLKRDFYAEMCRIERWSTRTLRQKIDGMLYERTAISKKPDQLIRQELDALRAGDRLTPELVFQDPYVLDFLGLKDTYSEQDLEAALIREVERFLLELGTGFAFVERQKRITLDGDDYYMDLLFYHRRLRRLVVIELKLDRYERQAGEEPPLAIILCAGKKQETVEYLDLDRSGIHVAEYLTDLPPREVLRERFHQAIATARARLENRSPEA